MLKTDFKSERSIEKEYYKVFMLILRSEPVNNGYKIQSFLIDEALEYFEDLSDIDTCNEIKKFKEEFPDKIERISKNRFLSEMSYPYY